MDQVKCDLVCLGIKIEKLDGLTIQKVKTAYHKAAKAIHPDKADPKNLEQVAEFTSKFQEIGNAYQRILRYLVKKIQEEEKVEGRKEEKNEEEKEAEVDNFIKKIFNKFNFPFENKGSFTVTVEDRLAEVWQDCLAAQYGIPRTDTNPNGTVCGRMWKFFFEVR